ncbi:thiol-disulfide oxidoreductase DCC family protein [Sutcliffiella rhizosphaerae]|nr:thiol-disulfide oxidoreductase DCC family protein [Sutcliffiella rhizosphaerae]
MYDEQSAEKHPILLFDGVCNLCNTAVSFIIKRDPNAVFKFTSLQSDEGQKLLQKHGLSTESFDSFYYVHGDEMYSKSTAALKVVRKLDAPWKFLYPLIFLPKPIRDIIYSFIAKNRYKWFGKKDQCMLPSPDIKKRFL